MKRPLCAMLAAYSAGIFAALRMRDFLITALIFCAAALVIHIIISRKFSGFAAAIALFFALGAALSLFQCAAAESAKEKYAAGNCTVTGRVVSIPSKGQFYLRVYEIMTEGGAQKVSQRVSVTLDKGEPRYGDIITAEVYMYAPRGKSNFGSFDYGEYLMQKHIYLAAHGESGAVIGHKASYFNPVDAAHLINAALRRRIKAAFPSDVSPLLKAFLLGDKSDIPPDLSYRLQLCGLSHIAAVSGMHISILLSFLSVIALFLVGRGRASRVIFILAVLFFILLTGAPVSVVRAGIMCIALQLSDLVFRENDSFSSLALALLLILLISPCELFNAAFLLSASATFGIIFFAARLIGYFSLENKSAAKLAAVTLSAELFTLPVVLSVYGGFSSYALFANMTALPVMPFILGGVLCFAVLGAIPVIGSITVVFTTAAARVLLFIVYAYSSTGIELIKVSGSVYLTVVIYAALIWIYLLLDGKRKRFAVIALTVAVTAFATGAAAQYFDRKNVTVEFISVGHGDCTLVYGGNTEILIDAGGNIEYDVGRQSVEPFLDYRSIGEIDAAFLSHYHYDHAAGMLSLIEDGYIRELFLPNDAEKTDLTELILDAARKAGTRVTFISYGDVVTTPIGKFTVISPRPGEGSGVNEMSAVMRFDAFGRSVLFTGDIGAETEKRILTLAENVDCDILKAAHHGSKNSSDAQFIAAASPRFAVISCGGLSKDVPQDVLERFYSVDATVYATSERGTVTFKIRPDGQIRVYTLR